MDRAQRDPWIIATIAMALPGVPVEAQARMTVVIDPDGQVNTDLTQYRTVTADLFFHRRMLEAVRRLEFEVGTVDREAVRYGHDLVIRTGRRSDTIPERLTLGDIREAARRGDHVRFRLPIDRMIEGLVPFVLILTPDAPSARMLRDHGRREFEFAVIRHPPFRPKPSS